MDLSKLFSIVLMCASSALLVGFVISTLYGWYKDLQDEPEPEKASKGFSVGDWVYHDFKLCQVVKVDNGRITHIENGLSYTMGYNLNESTVPLTIANKVISETFDYYYSRLHRKLKNKRLNWPDLARQFESMWIIAIQNQDNEEELQRLYGEMIAFAGGILDGTITTYNR